MAAFNEDFLCGGDFDVVLTIFRYDAKAFDAVEKIAVTERGYYICFLCVIVCRVTAYQ